MARNSLRATIILGLAAVTLFSSATLAFAPHVARVEVEPGTVNPGDEVSVFGPDGYGETNPVEIRWDDPEGEVLATAETGEGFFAPFGPVDVEIPDDAESGQHMLVVTQELDEGERHIRGLPAFAQVQVTGGAEPTGDDETAASSADPGTAERVSTLAEAEAPGLGLLVLVGVATLAIALAVAAVVTKALGRGPGADKTPQATRS